MDSTPINQPQGVKCSTLGADDTSLIHSEQPELQACCNVYANTLPCRFQASRRLNANDGLQQLLWLLSHHVDGDATSAVDIGCGLGVVAVHLHHLGLEVTAVASNPDSLLETARFQRECKVEFKIHPGPIDPVHLTGIPSADISLMLFGYQQIAQKLSLEVANRFLVQIFQQTHRQMFFQPSLRSCEYGRCMPFCENDIDGAVRYFTELLESSGQQVIAEFIGLTDYHGDVSESYRPVLKFSKVSSRLKPYIPRMDDAVENIRAARGRLLRIHVPRTLSPRDLQCYSLASGWHHFISAASSIAQALGDKEKVLTLERTEFYRYYQRVQPKTFGDLWQMAGCSGDIGLLAKMPMRQYSNWMPWSDSVDSVEEMQRGVSQADFIQSGDMTAYGPLLPEQVLLELQRMQRILARFSEQGYRPEVHDDGYVRGYVLRNGQESRFMLAAGQHRMGAIAALGYDWVMAKFQNPQRKVIDVAEVLSWPQVKNGRFSVKQAETIFNGIFYSTGLALMPTTE